MAHSLIVCGLDKKDWSEEKDVMIEHGCHSGIKLCDEDSMTWCAVCFSTVAAAEACLAHLQERFGHLRVCVEPDWQSFGKGRATATADMIRLAEWLGCRDKPHALPHEKQVCLGRGAAAVLAAVEAAGGADVLANADQAAAICLCHGLMQAPLDIRPRVAGTFTLLAPAFLAGAATDVRKGAPGSPQHACTAGILANAFMEMSGEVPEPLRTCLAVSRRAAVQGIASGCLGLLHAVADALSEWSEKVGRLVQQRRQHPNASMQQAAELLATASDLRDTGISLQTATASLTFCMQQHQLGGTLSKRQVLGTLGQLLHQLIICKQLDERGATVRLWPVATDLLAPAAVGQLLYAVLPVLQTMDGDAARAAAGVAALHAATSRALGTALEHLTAQRHMGLLFYLSQFTRFTVVGGRTDKEVSTLMTQLARIQRITAIWFTSPPDNTFLYVPVGGLPGFDKLLSGADQLALFKDLNASHLAGTLRFTIKSCEAKPANFNTKSIFNSGAINALAAELQVAPSRNMRSFASGLSQEDTSSCLAPGLFKAADALLEATQPANAAALLGKPGAEDAITALAHGGLGSFKLAHAEAAAQEALTRTTPWTMRPDPSKPRKTRLCAANILQVIAHGLTPPVARTLAKRGLVGPLLQAMPFLPTMLETAADIAAWNVTVLGTLAVGTIVAAVVTADPQAPATLLRDGSWDAALQRVRDLQPPQRLADRWAKQRDELLNMVIATVEASSRGGSSRDRRQHAAHCGAAAAGADPDAVAAAERAMQELLAEEEAAEAPAQRSKAAAKRARKKAAKQQQAAASVPAEQLTTTSAPPTTESPVSDPRPSSRSSTPAAYAGQPEEAGAAASSLPGRPAAASLPAQQAGAAAAHPAAEADWWRCSLSGEVMRDPVLYGSSGHSFERKALEEWLASNPGVDPTSLQPLPPQESSSIVTNHALRNLIQQLQPS